MSNAERFHNIQLPDLTQCFYQAETPLELWRLIESAFRNTKSFVWVELANQMHLMARILNDPNNIDVLNSFYKELAVFASELEREFKTKIAVEKRQKSIVEMLRKLIRYVLNNDSPYKIHDVFGFRFIVGTEDVDNDFTIKRIYRICNKTLDWLVMDKLCIPILTEAPENDELDIVALQNEGIFVPKKSLISPYSQKYFKDYFKMPKSTLYQASHLVVEIPTKQVPRGVPMEIQFRTLCSHTRAESPGPTDHGLHKDGKYSGIPDYKKILDPQKLNITGYTRKNDTIGLFDSIKEFKGIPS